MKQGASVTKFLRLVHYFKPDAPTILLSLGLLLASAAVGLLKPWPLAWIVDSVFGDKPLPPMLSWAGSWDKPFLLAALAATIVLLHAGQGILFAIYNFLSVKVGLRGLTRVRNELYAKLQRLSMRFHQGRNQGDLIYRASWDTYAFQTLFQQGFFTFLQASLSLILMFSVMWQVNRKLTLLSLSMVPLLLLAMKFFGGRMKQFSMSAHQTDSRVTTHLQQTIQTLPVIQSYTREEYEQKRFSEQVAASFDKRVAQHRWEIIYWLVIAIGFGLGTAAITWLGAKEVLSGRLTVGELLVFVAYLAQWYEPLNQLTHVGATVADASAGTQRVFEILDHPEEVKENPKARPAVSARDRMNGRSSERSETASRESAPLEVHGQVTFEDVSFDYDSGRLILEDINLSIAAGESVAIIGPSGVGKTTLLHLLPRFHDPTKGRVLLDGIDIRDLRLKDLRRQIAFVSQDPILLSATIAENIAYGRLGATRAEIEAAARAAHADEFIQRFADRYDAVVGDAGIKLSTGERQRINLARAFLKDAPILILDEPTSALDVESERLVLDSLADLMRNRTTLMVTHRLNTIRKVDRILVLENGRIGEIGTPEELLARSGYYARLIREVS